MCGVERNKNSRYQLLLRVCNCIKSIVCGEQFFLGKSAASIFHCSTHDNARASGIFHLYMRAPRPVLFAPAHTYTQAYSLSLSSIMFTLFTRITRGGLRASFERHQKSYSHVRVHVTKSLPTDFCFSLFNNHASLKLKKKTNKIII